MGCIYNLNQFNANLIYLEPLQMHLMHSAMSMGTNYSTIEIVDWGLKDNQKPLFVMFYKKITVKR